MQKVFLRGDGNNKIGFGHVYRLLALAEMLKDDFNCIFVINQPENFILEAIKKSCKNYISLDNGLPFITPDEIKADCEIDFDLNGIINSKDIVVTDGYFFGTQYQQAVKKMDSKLVCIDDLATHEFFADIVFNHAPGVDENLYKKQEYTKVFTGLDYAILRPFFFNPISLRSKKEKIAFISLGGSDYFCYTEKLVNILINENQFETLHIMCSSSFDKEMIKRLEQLYEKILTIHLYFNLSAEILVDLLDKCTHAFVSASTVLIESYARGLKCFAGFYTINQQFIYNGFVKENKAIGLNNFKSLTKQKMLEVLSFESELLPLYHPLSSKENICKIFAAL